MSEAALESMLNVAGVTALVGDRIQPGFLPQGQALPAITHACVSTVREAAMGADTGIARARHQLELWTETAAALRTLRTQVRLALQRKRGIYAGVDVEDVFIENESSAYEPEPADASGFAGRHRATIDIQMIFQEL